MKLEQTKKENEMIKKSEKLESNLTIIMKKLSKLKIIIKEFKRNINGINRELEKIKYGTIPAEAEKAFTLKKGCDDLLDLKNQNQILREKLYLLSRRLYTLEVRNFFKFKNFNYRWNIMIL